MQRANSLLLLGSIFLLGGIGIITSSISENISIFGVTIPKNCIGGSLLVWGLLVLFSGIHGYFLAERLTGFDPHKKVEESLHHVTLIMSLISSLYFLVILTLLLIPKKAIRGIVVYLLIYLWPVPLIVIGAWLANITRKKKTDDARDKK